MKLLKKIMIFLAIMLILFFILWRSPLPKDLGSGYTYDYNPVWTDSYMIVAPGNSSYIDGDVVDYVYNNEYIVAEEKSLDTFDHIYGKYMYELSTSKQMFDTFSFRQIWVIDKRTESLYGPYQKAVYRKIKDSLGIPDTLKLQFERQK